MTKLSMNSLDSKNRTYLTQARVFKTTLALGLLFFLTGCLSNNVKSEKPSTPNQRVYYGEYNDVEMAIRASMKKYPVKEDNLDAGIFETDFIKGDRMYRAPGSHERIESGVRYRISIHTIRGKVEGKTATQLIIKKLIEKTRDFFAEAELLGSDGLEENIIFYRIQRELTIAKAIRRAAEAPATPGK